MPFWRLIPKIKNNAENSKERHETFNNPILNKKEI